MPVPGVPDFILGLKDKGTPSNLDTDCGRWGLCYESHHWWGD